MAVNGDLLQLSSSNFLLRASNKQYVNASKSYLRSNATAAGTQLLVRNHNNFNTSWAVQVGEVGEEKTEIKIISGTPAGGTVNLTAGLSYSHPLDTPVYCYKYDKVVFNRSTTGTGGTYTPLTNGTVTITPDRFDFEGNSYTVFEETGGSVTYSYQIQLLNSVGTVLSGTSSEIVPSGYTNYSLYGLRQRVKNKVSYIAVEDEVIDELLNEWHEKMTNALINTNRDYAMGTTTISFNANQQFGTITAANFKSPRRVWFTGAAGTQNMHPTDLNNISPQNNLTSEYNQVYYFRGDNIIGRQPYSAAGTINIDYYAIGTQLGSDGEELPIPMRGHTRYYVDYAVDRLDMLDKGSNVSVSEKNSNESKWNAWEAQYKDDMSPRQQSGPEHISFTDYSETVW